MSDVRLGKSQVYASSLGLGTNAVGGHNLFPNLNENEGKKIIRTALDSGVTLLDTAYIYGKGRSEELIGEVIKEYDRNRIIIATKAAHDGSKKNNHPTFLKQSVEAALARLQTDYLDVFFIHFPDEDTPKAEAIGVLHDLKTKGLIRAIGVSNFSLDQIKEANLDGYLDVVEDKYNLLHRSAERELFPYLRKESISFIPYFPLASGLLTGKYQKDVSFSEEDLRSRDVDFKGQRYKQIIATVNKLVPLTEKYAVTTTQLVLAWYLKNKDVAAVIPGAKKSGQVDQNVLAADIHLTNEDYQYMDQLFKI